VRLRHRGDEGDAHRARDPGDCARVFGRIGRDQLEDYAGRKQMPVAEAEKWLRPNLG